MLGRPGVLVVGSGFAEAVTAHEIVDRGDKKWSYWRSEAILAGIAPIAMMRRLSRFIGMNPISSIQT
jgi:hypothetical protein